MNKKLLSLALTGIVAGGLMACEETTSSQSNDDTDANADRQVTETQDKIDQFTSDCESRNGAVKTNETCAGGNTCAGFNPNSGEEWTCQDKATCAGSVWCDEAQSSLLTEVVSVDFEHSGEAYHER